MADDVLLNKAATIERCVARVREEYAAAGAHFATDFTRQDAAVLNIQRACEAALDMGQHLIRRDRPRREAIAEVQAAVDAGIASGAAKPLEQQAFKQRMRTQYAGK